MSVFLRNFHATRWVPWSVFLLGITATLCLWRQLVLQENDHIQRSVGIEVKSVEHELRTWVRAQSHYIERMAALWSEHGPPQKDVWEDDVQFEMKLFKGLEALIWLPRERTEKWIVSKGRGARYISDLLANRDEMQAAARAEKSHKLTTAKVPVCEEQRSRFVVNVPIQGGGVLIGVFRIDQLMSTVLTNNAPDLIIQLREEGLPVFQNVPGSFGDKYTVRHSLRVFGNSWTLAACPTDVFVKREHSTAVGITLLVGAGVSWLLSLVVGMAIRTHSQKLVLESNKDELAHFSSIVSNCQDAVISTTIDGKIDSWNSAAELLFGYRAADAIGKHVSILDCSNPDPQENELFESVCRGEWVDPFDTVRSRKDGSLVDISLNQSPITDSHDTIVGVSYIARDISDRIRDHKQLAHFSSIISTSQDAIVSTTKTGEIISWNDSARMLFGYQLQEVIGKHVSLLDPPNRDKREDELFQQVSKGEWVEPFDTVRKRSDGSLLNVSLNESPISCDGEIVGVSAIARDISDRIRVQNQLHDNARLLKEANESLNASYAKAEAATKAKSQFLANMSHEIRTPMTAILGFADVLADRKGLDAEMRDATDTIKRNGEYLLQIINNILDLSKIEADKMEVEKITTDPMQLVNDVKKLMRVRAHTRGLDIEIESRSNLPETILSDPVRLKQVLVNLMGNAIKFTEQGTIKIGIEFLPASHELVLEIIDNGIGMTSDQLERLFKPFTQADATTTRRFGGTGLGLTISERLVQLLGGRIVVESEIEKGSTFRVVLQLQAGEIGTLIAGSDVTTEKTRDNDKADLPALDCKILLAEDGKDNQRLISFVLKKAGATVTIVEDGKSAVEEAMDALHADHRDPFDVILMDMQMPIMDGYEAATRLRELGYERPIVALTANAMTGDREKCLAAGCTDYATKPIVREELIPMIADHAESLDDAEDDTSKTIVFPIQTTVQRTETPSS